MGWLEKVAAQDLKLRLIVGPAVITFATALMAGVFFLGPERGALHRRRRRPRRCSARGPRYCPSALSAVLRRPRRRP